MSETETWRIWSPDGSPVPDDLLSLFPEVGLGSPGSDVYDRTKDRALATLGGTVRAMVVGCRRSPHEAHSSMVLEFIPPVPPTTLAVSLVGHGGKLVRAVLLAAASAPDTPSMAEAIEAQTEALVALIFLTVGPVRHYGPGPVTRQGAVLLVNDRPILEFKQLAPPIRESFLEFWRGLLHAAAAALAEEEALLA